MVSVLRRAVVMMAAVTLVLGQGVVLGASLEEGVPVVVAYSWTAVDDEDTARVTAVALFREAVSSRAVAYVESRAAAVNGVLTENEVQAVSAGTAVTTGLTVTPDPRRRVTTVSGTVTVDRGKLSRFLNSVGEERRRAVREYQALRQRDEELGREVASLRARLEALRGQGVEVKALKKEARAIDLWRRGEVNGDLALLNEAIRLNPRLALAYSSRADLFLKNGLEDKAVADLNALLALGAVTSDAKWANHMAAFAYLKMGSALLKRNSPGQAVKVMEKVAKYAVNAGDPRLAADAYVCVGRFYADKGKPAKAAEAYKKAVSYDGGYWYVKDLSNVYLEQGQDASDAGSDAYYGEHYRSAVSKYVEALGFFAEAMVPLRKAGINGGLAWVLVNAGKANLDLADAYDKLSAKSEATAARREALVALDEAVGIDPDNTYTLSLRGDALASLGRRDEARVDYRKIVRLTTGNPDACDNLRKLGDAYRRLGEYDLAVKAYRAALKKNPCDTLSKIGLEWAQKRRTAI